jgi:hypothetical protein
LDPREPSHHNESGSLSLHYPPAYILVCLHRTKIETLQGLPPQVIPIKPLTKTFSIQIAGESIAVTRTQLPITPAYAFTDYRSQGQTICPIFVDIGRPPSGNLTPFNIYVALSRAKNRASIRLLRDFDEKLFQQHPNEYLRIEDNRLLQLDRETKTWWQSLSTYISH